MNLKGRKLVVFVVLATTVALAYQLPYLRYNFYQQMMDGLALTDYQIGIIGSIVSLATTICYPIGGVLADRLSTKSLITTTLAAFVGLSVWYAFAQGFIQLAIIHGLFAFFGIATLWSAYLAAIRNLADEKNQSKIFGWNEGTRGIVQFLVALAIVGLMGVAINAAALSGGFSGSSELTELAAAGNLEAVEAFSAGSALGFRYTMLFAAGISAIALVVAIVFMEGNGKKKAAAGADAAADANDAAAAADAGQQPETGRGKRYTTLDVLRTPGVWIVTFLIMFAYLMWSMGNSYLTQYTTDILGLDSGMASAIGTVRTYLIVAVAGFLGGVVLDKFKYKGRSFIVLFVLDVAMVVLVMVTGSHLALCVAITICVAFISNIMKTTYWSTMGEVGIPAGMTALATGIISLVAFIPDWIYPTVFGSMLNDARIADGGVSGAAVAGVYQIIFVVLLAVGVAGMVLSMVHWNYAKKLESSDEVLGNEGVPGSEDA